MRIAILCFLLGLFAGLAPAAELPLKLVSFNIRYLTDERDEANEWETRRHLSLAAMRHFDADIIGVQEALKPQLDFLLAGMPGFAMAGVGRDDGVDAGEFSAILYRTDRFRLADSGTFWLSDTPEIPGSTTWGNEVVRICTWARLIDKPTGRGFYVFNTHFDHRVQRARERSARLIVKRIVARPHPDEPVVLMGDLNIDEDNPATRYLKGESIDLDGGPENSPETSPIAFADTYRILHPEDPNARTLHFWKGLREGSKIDYIFVDPASGVKVVAAWIDPFALDGHYPSDHFPVRARIVFP